MTTVGWFIRLVNLLYAEYPEMIAPLMAKMQEMDESSDDELSDSDEEDEEFGLGGFEDFGFEKKPGCECRGTRNNIRYQKNVPLTELGLSEIGSKNEIKETLDRWHPGSSVYLSKIPTSGDSVYIYGCGSCYSEHQGFMDEL